MSYDEPTLDGMPDPPAPWDRPEQGVRMGALELVHMLSAALPNASTDEEMPALCALRLGVIDDHLTVAATDRYTLFHETRQVDQTCSSWRFLLRTGDARSALMLLKRVIARVDKEYRDQEPCDLTMDLTDEGPTLRILGQDLDVRFTEAPGLVDFPPVEEMLHKIVATVDLDPPARFDVTLTPELIARAVPVQRAGRAGYGFRFRSARPGREGTPRPVVVTTHLAPDLPADDLFLIVMPQRSAKPTKKVSPGAQLLREGSGVVTLSDLGSSLRPGESMTFGRRPDEPDAFDPITGEVLDPPP